MWAAVDELPKLLHRVRSGTALDWNPHALKLEVQPRRLCLVCHKPMTQLRASHALLDHCVEHGYWFDASELSAVLLAHRSRASEDEIDLSIDSQPLSSRRQIRARSLLRYVVCGAVLGLATALVRGMDPVVTLAVTVAAASGGVIVFMMVKFPDFFED